MSVGEPVSKMEDEELREMFLLAGVRVDSEDDVRAFAKLIRWLFQREESFIKRKTNQGKMVGAMVVALFTAVLGWSVPSIVTHVAALYAQVQPWIAR